VPLRHRANAISLRLQFPSGATLYDVNMRRLNYSGPMTLELNMLAAQRCPWAGTNRTGFAYCKPAAWLSVDREFPGRGRASVDRSCACRRHTQLDD
jgi:hypothetical protein